MEDRQRKGMRRFVLVHLVILVVLGIYLSGGQAQARAVVWTENFNPGSAEAFQAALGADVDTVVLNVSGGYLTEGMAIGRIIRARKLRVVVPEGGVCLSACAEAFLGGVRYRIDGVLAFHIPRVARAGSRQEAFGFGLAGGTLTTVYRYEMGFGFDLTRDINKWTTSSRLLAFRDTDALLDYRKGRGGLRLPDLMQYGQ